MHTIFATCGLAFSGKTTLAKQLSKTLGIPRVSLDAINAERGLHGGDGLTDTQWEESSAMAVERLNRILAAGQSVVLDDTLSHRFLRDRYRQVAIRANANFVLLYLDTALEDIAGRMTQNRKDPVRQGINDNVFAAHRDRFERPTDDEKPIKLASASDISNYLASLKLALD